MSSQKYSKNSLVSPVLLIVPTLQESMNSRVKLDQMTAANKLEIERFALNIAVNGHTCN